MSSAEKIKRLFAKSDVTVNSEVDDRIINDALTAIDKFEKVELNNKISRCGGDNNSSDFRIELYWRAEQVWLSLC